MSSGSGSLFHPVIIAMAQTHGSQCCCLPLCTNSRRKELHLSLRITHSDIFKRRQVLAVWRNEGPDFIWRFSSSVCSLHFEDADIVTLGSGRKHLREHAVLCKFKWNNWGQSYRLESVYERARARLGGGEGMDAGLKVEKQDGLWIEERPTSKCINRTRDKLDKRP